MNVRALRAKAGLSAAAVALAGVGLAVTTATPASALSACSGSKTLYTASGALANLPALNGSIYNCQLAQGNAGTGVKRLQLALNLCYDRDLDLDGIFGPATKAALVYAQGKAGTAADGIYGPNTRDAIKWPWWTEAYYSCYKRP
ncbi:peptidoglycan-binding protein [Streptomyces sp. NBC_00038]|uniref:peptidoglycan-binding domain-containing protein n=1 Tax=Streptomyces sp. NBC_00038 TaxID=2903615 RepID=UPI002251476F|nr:peptidoglycan-binding domain-containing protein [Streptomyces sp. NBC_00038]MCX5560155.1 peptidoglycan-binding protein [Streptomyces sp. NBC_00038]